MKIARNQMFSFVGYFNSCKGKIHLIILMDKSQKCLMINSVLTHQLLSSNRASMVSNAKDGLEKLLRWQSNWDSILLEDEVMQRSLQYYCSSAEWIVFVACSRQRWADFC